MMNKKTLIYLVMLGVSVNFIGCSSESANVKEEKVRAVKVESMKKEKYPVTLNYVGTVDSKNLVKQGFKSAGRLKKVYVKKGELVKKGQKLIEIDKSDLMNAYQAAEGQMNAAKSQYDKALAGATKEEINQVKADVDTAKRAFELMKDTYENLEAMYEKGGISEQRLKEAKLQYDKSRNDLMKANEGLARIEDGAREEDIKAAKAQYEAAKAQFDIRKDLLNDAILYSTEEGKVVDVLYEVGELVPQGYPAVVVRSNIQVVNVGIAQKDLPKVSIGTKAIIDVDGEVSQGEIVSIDEAPDEDTRTYKAEIEIDAPGYYLGTIAKVSLQIGEESGVWTPVSSVLSNGVDYVYVIKNERAFKKTVELEEIYNDRIKVEGLEENDLVVIEGTKNLSDGLKVNIVE